MVHQRSASDCGAEGHGVVSRPFTRVPFWMTLGMKVLRKSCGNTGDGAVSASSRAEQA
jgi:hypothetical protein